MHELAMKEMLLVLMAITYVIAFSLAIYSGRKYK